MLAIGLSLQVPRHNSSESL